MNLKRIFISAILAASFLFGGNALAATSGAPQILTMQAAMRPMTRQSTAYTGILKLKITPDGLVNGTYVSNSIRPDPSYGKIITVTGGLNGQNIHLAFGTTGNFRVTGTLTKGHLVGTAFTKGQMYQFEASLQHAGASR
jgi:hypothetical protein